MDNVGGDSNAPAKVTETVDTHTAVVSEEKAQYGGMYQSSSISSGIISPTQSFSQISLSIPDIYDDEPTGLTLIFKTLSGLKVELLNVDLDSTVFDVKQRLGKVPSIGVNPLLQRLIFMGKEVENDTKLRNIHAPLVDGSVFHVLLRNHPYSNTAYSAPAPTQSLQRSGPPEPAPFTPTALPSHVVYTDSTIVDVERSSRIHRYLGIFLMACGALFFIWDLYSGGWRGVLVGFIIFALGYFQVKVSNDLRQQYCRSFYIFSIVCTFLLMIVLVSFTIAKEGDTDGDGDRDLPYGILITIAIILPWTCCSSCIYLAYHRLQLLKRDQQRNR